jgi:hypothetical protein
VHLDLHTDNLYAEVARSGIRRPVRAARSPGRVMRDPAGLLFCVLPKPPGNLHETNAQPLAMTPRPPSGNLSSPHLAPPAPG